MTRRLAREEALLVGGSCGMAVCAAAKVAAEAGPDDVIVVLLPDGGRGYLSTVFNDGWMSSYGFLTPDTTEWTVGDVLRRKDGSIPDLVHGHPNETVADAVSIMREFGVSQMPIVKRRAAGHGGRGARRGDRARPARQAVQRARPRSPTPSSDHLSNPLPSLGSTEPLSKAVQALRGGDGALVVVDGRPAGIVTRADILAFLATGSRYDMGGPA